ncbi:TetR/AcrR family transcriptional regulator C-terminal domain-containing protein, partial [Dysosmobacter welbionis]
AQGPEEAEQQRRQGDAGGLPLAEDHHRQGQEAETGHAVFKLPLADARDDIHNAAQAAQHAGDQYAGVAHPVDVDAHGIRCLGMLAAGAQPQAEAGLVQHHIGDYQGDHRQQHAPVELKAADVHQECLAAVQVLDGGGHVVRIGGGVHGLHEHGGRGGAQQVHGRAHQCLVRLEVHGRHRQQ